MTPQPSPISEAWHRDAERRRILEAAAAASTPADAFFLLFHACEAKTGFFNGVPTASFLDLFCADPSTESLVVSSPKCEPGLTRRSETVEEPVAAAGEPGIASAGPQYAIRYTYSGRPEWRRKVRFVWPNQWEGWRYALCDGDVHYWASGQTLKLQDRLLSRAFVFEYVPDPTGGPLPDSRFEVRETSWGCIGIRKDFSEPRTAGEHMAAMKRESSRPILEGHGWGEGVEWIDPL
jgi:hypothetical protein